MKTKVCSRCKGYGTLEIGINHPYTEYKTEKCKKCNGSGLMTVFKFKLEVPFIAEEETGALENAVAKILKIIDEFDAPTQ